MSQQSIPPWLATELDILQNRTKDQAWPIKSANMCSSGVIQIVFSVQSDVSMPKLMMIATPNRTDSIRFASIPGRGLPQHKHLANKIMKRWKSTVKQNKTRGLGSVICEWSKVTVDAIQKLKQIQKNLTDSPPIHAPADAPADAQLTATQSAAALLNRIYCWQQKQAQAQQQIKLIAAQTRTKLQKRRREIEAQPSKRRRLDPECQQIDQLEKQLQQIECKETKCQTARTPQCSVCWDADVKALFLPCMHAVTCAKCAVHFVHANCPMCRSPVEDVKSVYL